MNAKKNIILAAMGLVMAATAVTGASAETRFDRTHPARAEVNVRLANENHRITYDQREGRISKIKAMRLHASVHRIRIAERRMAAHHHGHVTKLEQMRLNRAENRIGRSIG